MINSAKDAERFAEHLKFPPLGRRSWGPRAALALSGLSATDYLKTANAFTLAIAMVETSEALDAVDEIIAVDGVDGVFVGPGDLSIALSHGPILDTSSSSVNKALDRIVASAKARGKFAGLYCPDGARANMRASEGSHSARCRRIKCCCARRRGRSSLSQGADLGRWRRLM